MSYDWPGNVRELQNLMERAVLLSGAGPIQPVHFLLDPDAWPLFGSLSEEGAGAPDAEQTEARETESGTPSTIPAQMDAPSQAFVGAVIPLHEMERIMIAKGLEQTSGNRTQAAELLGISVRTLRNKLNEYRAMGLDME